MKAYKILEKFGWTQQYYGDEQEGFCLVGAIRKAYPARDSEFYVLKLIKRFPRRFGKGVSVTEWNDNPSLRRYQVIKLLKDANI
jgi:hypothetical protein